MKVALYLRVSTTEQTVEQQEIPLIAKCKAEGWDYATFSDIGVSGAKESRPALDRMMQGIRKGEFNAVMIWKLDRLGRSLSHLLQLIQEFHNKKVKFICFSPDIDTDTAQGRFFLQVMGAVAELEREMIRTRIKEKLSVMKQKGIKLGRKLGSKDKGRRKRAGYFERYKKTTLSEIK